MNATQRDAGKICEHCERYRRRFRRLVWTALAASVVLPVVAMWLFIVSQSDDEIVTIVRNEVVQDASGGRLWRGAFVNTDDAEYREVAATIRFLDKDNRKVGETSASADVLGYGQLLPLEAPLPASAVRMQMFSLYWRRGRDFKDERLFGPYTPWEFGYLQCGACRRE